MDKNMKLVIFGDIHLGPNMECRPGDEVEGLMGEFIRIVNDELKPDAIIELGDRINNQNHDLDKKNLMSLAALFSRFKAPVFHVYGNHDIHHLSKEENREILRSEVSFRKKQLKDYELIFVDSVEPMIDYIGGDLSDAQLKWIAEALSENTKPKILFGHHPLLKQDLYGNPHFDAFPHLAAVKDGGRLASILEKNTQVIAYINGHAHWFYNMNEGGVSYTTVPSFTDAYPLSKGAPGRYAELFLSETGMKMYIKTLAPKRVLGCFERRF